MNLKNNHFWLFQKLERIDDFPLKTTINQQYYGQSFDFFKTLKIVVID
jgi:hypothetical protein